MRTQRSGPPILDRQSYQNAEAITHTRMRVISNPRNVGTPDALLAKGSTRNLLRAMADALLSGEAITLTTDGRGNLVCGPVVLISRPHRNAKPRTRKPSKRAEAKAAREAYTAEQAREAEDARMVIIKAVPALAYKPGFAG